MGHDAEQARDPSRISQFNAATEELRTTWLRCVRARQAAVTTEPTTAEKHDRAAPKEANAAGPVQTPANEVATADDRAEAQPSCTQGS